MARKSFWPQMDHDDVQRHALYGVRGWLLAIYLVILIVLITRAIPYFAVAQLSPATKIGSPYDLIASVLLYLPFLALTPFEHPAMPLLASWGASLYPAASAAIGVLENRHDGIERAFSAEIGSFIFLVTLTVPFVGYLARSKRVDVTFRHRVRKESDA